MLFDDSTTGLDPVISTSVDDEIVKLRDLQQVTSIVVSQQIRDAHYIATHATEQLPDGRLRVVAEDTGRATFMVLHDGRILFEGTAADLFASKDAYLQRFLYCTLPPW